MNSYNKWQSRRWLITLWAIVILTTSLILKFEPSWMIAIAAIPPAYIAAESYTKTHRSKDEC